MKTFAIGIIILFVLIICFAIFWNTPRKRCKHETYHGSGSGTGIIPGGPIRVEFSIVKAVSDTKNDIVKDIQTFKIDNNGNGYLSLTDLFFTQEIIGGKPCTTLNDKIIGKLTEFMNKTGAGKTNGFFDAEYFAQSTILTCCQKQGLLPCGKKAPAINISNFIVKFDSGQSYVNTLGSIGVNEIGDPWGPPKFFEIGGQRYDKGSYTPNPTNIEPKMQLNRAIPDNVPDGTGTVSEISLQFSSVRIVGQGQSMSTIRGSCIFVLYNMVDYNQTITGAFTSWLTKLVPSASATGRIQCEGFLWTGHFGICNDFNVLTQKDSNYKPQNTIIGYDPCSPLDLPTEAKPPCDKIEVINYNTQVDPNNNYGCGVEGVPVFRDKEVEILMINVWIQLDRDLIESTRKNFDAGGSGTPTFLGYPLLTVNLIRHKRIYMSNVNVFSYQVFNPGCKGLVYTHSNFYDTDYPFPGDTFIQQCAFSSRNINIGQDKTSAEGNLQDATSLCIENGDKISIVNSTFHGLTNIESNKLAMFNCYCLHVGNPFDASKNSLANPAVIFYTANNENSGTSGTGYGALRTQSRVILQNIIFVIHINKTNLNNILTGSGTSTTNYDTLYKIYKGGFFNLGSHYDYYSTSSVYPFQIRDNKTATNSQSASQNVFFQNCVYYAIMVAGDASTNAGRCPYSGQLKKSKKSGGCPFGAGDGETTFSAITLNNIQNVVVQPDHPRAV